MEAATHETQDPTTDELDELEDLDDGSEGADVGDAAGSESAGAEKGKGNKWDALPSLSSLIEQADAKKEGKDGKTAPAGDGEAVDPKQSDGERDAAKDDAGKEKKPGETRSDARDGAANARYTVKDAEGNALAFELEPGTTIAFKADGKDVTVNSFDELIGYASKGVHADKQLSTMGQRVSGLERSNAELKTQSEELLLKALFDREARSALRKALAPFRDPEVRKGHDALAREADRKAGEKTETEQKIAEAREEFWTGVGRQMKAALSDFEYLTDEDAPEITKVFYANYEQTFEAEVKRELTAGKSEEEAVAAAQHAAFQSLDDANLRKAMEAVHQRYVTRLGAPPKKKIGAPPKEPANAADAARAAEAHNRHTDTKLEQRRSAPRLRTAGAAPVATPVKPPEPTTHKARENEIKGLFRTMRGET